jgi:adenine-specific DNA-methyltransferase
MDYSCAGGSVSDLKSFVGRTCWLEAVKLTVESRDLTEFIVLSGRGDPDRVDAKPMTLGDEFCRTLLALPARILGPCGGTAALDDVRDAQIAIGLRQSDERADQLLDEETIKLDRWSDDLKLGLERDLKGLDREIAEARRASSAAVSLEDELAAQRQVRNLEASRSRKRRELFDAQDSIDCQRDELIRNIEAGLKRSHDAQPLFAIRWRLL